MAAKKSLNALLVDLDSYWPLKDANELLKLHSPAQTLDTRRAILNAAVVLLAAHFEAYAESLFERGAELHYDSLADDQISQLLNQTARKFHAGSVGSFDLLFYNLGIQAITSRLSWSGWNNQRIRTELGRLIEARHYVAHGSRGKSGIGRKITKVQVMQWAQVVAKSLEQMLELVTAHVETD